MGAHLRRRLALLALAGLGLAGCAAVPDGQELVNRGRQALDAAPLCCSGLADAPRHPLPLAEPAVVEINAESPAFQFGGNKAFFRLYELPAYTQPYAIVLSSRSQGPLNDAALFIPRVALYDDQYTVLRYFDEKTLRNRGNQLERTVFINPANQGERYLAVYGSDLSSSIERAYSQVTVSTVMAGPVMFNLYGGHDGKSILRSAPTGTVHIEVQGLQPAAAAASSAR